MSIQTDGQTAGGHPSLEPHRRPRSSRTINLSDGAAVIRWTTIAIFTGAAIFVHDFATTRNLRALFLSVALVGIAAVGLSLITIVGQLFSLSISATVAVSTIVFASQLHRGPVLALVSASAFGLISGLLQGALVGPLGTDPIVTTIAAAAMMTGVAQLLTGGRNITGVGDPSMFGRTFFGIIPAQVLIFFVVTLCAWWYHRFSLRGRVVTLVGLNERAALVAGLRSWSAVLMAFAVSGTLAGIAGGLLASESGQGNLQLGATFGFDAIAAVVVGGISVKGGRGNPIDAAVGAFLVGLLGNVLILVGLTYQIQLIFKGVLVLLAVVLAGGTARTTTRGVRGPR